jgi:hypothetical protein
LALASELESGSESELGSVKKKPRARVKAWGSATG